MHVCVRMHGLERVHPMHLRTKEPNRMRRDARPKGAARMPAGHACVPHAVVGTLAQRPAHRVEGRVVGPIGHRLERRQARAYAMRVCNARM